MKVCQHIERHTENIYKRVVFKHFDKREQKKGSNHPKGVIDSTFTIWKMLMKGSVKRSQFLRKENKKAVHKSPGYKFPGCSVP